MIQDIFRANNRSDMITEILIFILAILIGTFVLRFLWNRSLVKHVTVLRPLETMLDAFLLTLALAVVRG